MSNLISASLLLPVLVVNQTALDGWSFEVILPPPGATITAATAISGDGEVVVGWTNPDSVNGVVAFRWRSGMPMELLSLDDSADGARPNAVSHDGSFVAGTMNYPDGGPHGVRWDGAGSLLNLRILTGVQFWEARGVSDDGQVLVGHIHNAPGHTSVKAALVTASGHWELLGSLATGTTDVSYANSISGDGDVIVGVATHLSGGAPFRWTLASGMQPLGVAGEVGPTDSETIRVSADGAVVVGRGGNSAIRWTQSGGFTDLGTLPFFYSALPHAVSEDGQVIVGESGDAHGIIRPFIWTPTTGMRDLTLMLMNAGLDLYGWELWNATGVSRDGRTIVGNGLNPAGERVAWVAEIQLPTDCPADLNLDGRVDGADLGLLLSQWGVCPSP